MDAYPTYMDMVNLVDDVGNQERLAQSKAASHKRPTNGFIRFALEKRSEVTNDHPGMSNREITKLLSTRWKRMSRSERKPYENDLNQSDFKHRRRGNFRSWEYGSAKQNMPIYRTLDNDSKDGKDDSEDEAMDMDEPEDVVTVVESDKSTDESTSSAETDAEDSSDMDEEECELRRTECLYDMHDLEKQFSDLKENLYRERISQIESKLKEVHLGVAPEYLIPLGELQENMRIRTQVAGILKELRTEAVRKDYDCELQSAHQSYESDKLLVYDQVKSELEEKIRHLEEDRDNIDITSDIWNELHFGSKKKKKQTSSMFPEKRRKPVTVTGPYIVYMLSEADVLEDWTIIKKAMGIQKRKVRL